MFSVWGGAVPPKEWSKTGGSDPPRRVPAVAAERRRALAVDRRPPTGQGQGRHLLLLLLLMRQPLPPDRPC